MKLGVSIVGAGFRPQSHLKLLNHSPIILLGLLYYVNIAYNIQGVIKRTCVLFTWIITKQVA